MGVLFSRKHRCVCFSQYTAYFLRWSASELPRVWANMSKSSGFRQELEDRALPMLSIPTSRGGGKEAEADELIQNSDMRVCKGSVYGHLMATTCAFMVNGLYVSVVASRCECVNFSAQPIAPSHTNKMESPPPAYTLNSLNATLFSEALAQNASNLDHC